MKINYEWIYTYSYAPDSVWEPWRSSPAPAAWIEAEAASVYQRLQNKRETVQNRLTFALLTDTHYTHNGTWDDTIYSLKCLKSLIDYNGIIHLGDLTDGMLSATHTQELEDIVIKDLNTLNVPVYLTPGNHDYNYFKGNPDIRYPERPQYYTDICEKNLRMIFIDSFDPKEEIRYGFTDYCIHWLETVLYHLPTGYSAIIFSHITPLVRLQTWTKEIRNREKLMNVLNKYADSVLAFINGHSHCDHLFNNLYNDKFPIITVNCSKCEYFLDHKPDGADVPYREVGNRTQESFDIMEIDTNKREIFFVRFGAGRDRIVQNGKAKWLYENIWT